MSYKNSKLVEITWRDAYTLDGWHTWKELVDKVGKGELCKTVGWLVIEDDLRVVLVTSVGIDFVDAEVGSAWVIPKGMVEAIRVIEEAKPEGEIDGSKRLPESSA